MTLMIDTGNYIAAKAAIMAKPDVVAAYPITPQTTLVEGIANYVKTGEFKGEYICVESEHSAMCACIGASAAGVRTFTGTSSHGLLLMHEMLHWAALARLPVVMCNINRVVGPGWNIWPDENDSISQRDTGWIQFYCSSNQEIFDTVIQAFKLAENEKVLLPVMINYNAFILSHTSMPVYIPEQKEVDDFIPKYKPNGQRGLSVLLIDEINSWTSRVSSNCQPISLCMVYMKHSTTSLCCFVIGLRHVSQLRL